MAISRYVGAEGLQANACPASNTGVTSCNFPPALCRAIFKVVQTVQSLHLLSSKSCLVAACLLYLSKLGLLRVILFQATALAATAATTASDAVCSPRQLLGQQKPSLA